MSAGALILPYYSKVATIWGILVVEYYHDMALEHRPCFQDAYVTLEVFPDIIWLKFEMSSSSPSVMLVVFLTLPSFHTRDQQTVLSRRDGITCQGQIVPV